MAFIKIDTDKMQTVVDNLEDRAAAIDYERNAINHTSNYYHDPVPSVVDATDAGPRPGPLAQSAYDLRDLAAELNAFFVKLYAEGKLQEIAETYKVQAALIAQQ